MLYMYIHLRTPILYAPRFLAYTRVSAEKCISGDARVATMRHSGSTTLHVRVRNAARNACSKNDDTSSNSCLQSLSLSLSFSLEEFAVQNV